MMDEQLDRVEVDPVFDIVAIRPRRVAKRERGSLSFG